MAAPSQPRSTPSQRRPGGDRLRDVGRRAALRRPQPQYAADHPHGAGGRKHPAPQLRHAPALGSLFVTAAHSNTDKPAALPLRQILGTGLVLACAGTATAFWMSNGAPVHLVLAAWVIGIAIFLVGERPGAGISHRPGAVLSGGADPDRTAIGGVFRISFNRRVAGVRRAHSGPGGAAERHRGPCGGAGPAGRAYQLSLGDLVAGGGRAGACLRRAVGHGAGDDHDPDRHRSGRPHGVCRRQQRPYRHGA